MNKDEFSDNAKAPDKKGDATKSSARSASQARPSPPGPRPPVPRPPFAGPMHVAVNIKPLLPVVKPVQENAVIKSQETKDE
jgi:hypothetical protein